MEFKEQIKDFEERFKASSIDYYEGGTIISKLIHNQKLLDRYYRIIEEFKGLKANIYSDKHVSDLFRAKKNKSILALNIYRSRALGLLSIADEIARLNINNSMTKKQIDAYRELQLLRMDMMKYAENNLNYSNIIATQQHYEKYEKGV